MVDKILIIFGSKSDESVYGNIVDILKGNENIHYEMRICSAHRTPEELGAILNTDAKVIIAGAGLAAHLPGVIASKTLRPVIGVPVEGNYKGLDALLSIMQMPPGVPVLSTGVNKSDVAAKLALLMLKKYDKVHIFGDENNNAVKKAIDTLDEFNVSYELNPDFKANSINIKFVSLDEEAEKRDDLIIYVPIIDEDDDKAEAALNILKNSANGLWVGLNRGENAALAAIEIMGSNNEYADKLDEYRKSRAEKVKQHDKEVNEK
ncbi:MAG: AIR carboxylase family protein [Nanoarchaeota archaeon]|nr:AIR carboxylase family protein [Nanoarchaeota archaeon]